MIVKMKKITVLAVEKYAAHTVEALRKLGFLHVSHMQQPRADYITSLEHKLIVLDKALLLLKDVSKQKQERDKERLLSYEKEIMNLSEQNQHYIAEKQKTEEKLLWYKNWGDISLVSVEEIEKAGIFIKLYLCSKSELKKISQDKCVYIISQKGGQVQIVFVSANEEETLGFTQIGLPREGRHSSQRKMTAISEHLEKIEKRVTELSAYRKSFLEYKKDLLKNLEFYKVRFGMAHKEGICCLQGFCPQGSVSQIEKVAKLKGWAVMIEEPEDPLEVPTLVSYPRWTKAIKPIFDFMGTLPGYKEYDISPWFLLFFSLFFAMLIGDAGYGFLFLGVTFFARRKLPKAPREPFFLMYILAVATIIWGAVTGTWFGAEKIGQLPGFEALVVDKINSFAEGNQNFMIYICFLIGAVHLTLAHAIVAFKYINSWIALSQVGWIMIVWTSFFIAGKLVLSKAMPGFALILGLLGVLLVILFSNFQKNILKGALISLADLPLKAIGCFADVVSYLRLFAVGYASVVLAVTFNNMAFDLGFNTIFTAVLAVFILFLGHSLNIVLGFMGVIVHGIRLNMLEFSGHLNMEWSGRQYKPFKE